MSLFSYLHANTSLTYTFGSLKYYFFFKRKKGGGGDGNSDFVLNCDGAGEHPKTHFEYRADSGQFCRTDPREKSTVERKDAVEEDSRPFAAGYSVLW